MKLLFALFFIGMVNLALAQKIESIHFNPLTDSIKKGFNYYINIDAKLVNNKWLPLTDGELIFKANHGQLKGNNILVPFNFEPKEINISVVLKADTSKILQLIIPIKQMPDPELKPIEPAKDTPKAIKKSKKKSESK